MCPFHRPPERQPGMVLHGEDLLPMKKKERVRRDRLPHPTEAERKEQKNGHRPTQDAGLRDLPARKEGEDGLPPAAQEQKAREGDRLLPSEPEERKREEDVPVLTEREQKAREGDRMLPAERKEKEREEGVPVQAERKETVQGEEQILPIIMKGREHKESIPPMNKGKKDPAEDRLLPGARKGRRGEDLRPQQTVRKGKAETQKDPGTGKGIPILRESEKEERETLLKILRI